MKRLIKHIFAAAAVTLGVAACGDDPQPQPADPKPTPSSPHSIVFTASEYGTSVATIDDMTVKSAVKDEVVTIEVTMNKAGIDAGCTFGGWEVVSGAVTLEDATALKTTFAMPDEGVELRPLFLLPEPPTMQRIILDTEGVTGGTFAAYAVDKETKITEALSGTRVKLIAIEKVDIAGREQYALVEWVVTGAEVEDKTATVTYFTMPRNDVTVKATFRKRDDLTFYNVNCEQTTGGAVKAYIGQTEVTEAEQGRNMRITAIADPGYKWVSWNCSENVRLDNSTLYDPATFRMPAGDITVKANFEEITYTIRLTMFGAGGGDGASATAYVNDNKVFAARPGQTVKLVVVPPTESSSYTEMAFTHWAPEPGLVLASTTDKITTFTMPERNVQIGAHFSERAPTGSATGDARFYGTWVESATGSKIIITESTFVFLNTAGKGYDGAKMRWNAVDNSGEFASPTLTAEHPKGYRLEVQRPEYWDMEYSGVMPWRESGLSAGNLDTFFEWWYINAAGTQLMPGRNPTGASGGKGPYIKQP